MRRTIRRVASHLTPSPLSLPALPRILRRMAQEQPLPLEVAERFFQAVQAGDIDALREIYAPGAEVWHNFDQRNQPAEENIRVIRWMHRRVKELRYEEVRRFEIPGGFVQQHVLRGIAPNGEVLEVPAAVICTIAGGKVTRVEEYLDSQQTAALNG